MVDKAFESLLDTERLRSIAEQALLEQGIGANTEAGLVITGQEHMRELNRDFRGHDEPTDVLAFAMQDSPAGTFVSPPDGTLHLGEVIISYPQALLQAAERGHPVTREVAILIVHGMLHLLGFDHDEPGPEAEMKAREKAILVKLKEVA